MKINHTNEQILAINHIGNMVITACPGSGKTTVIVEKIRNCLPLLKEYQGVIAITFTVKASDELKRRCKKNGFNTKQSFFGTIDSFCLKEIIYPFISRVWGKSLSELNVVYKNNLEPDDIAKYKDITSVILTTANTTPDIIEKLIELYRKGFILMSTVGIIANYIVDNSLSCRKYLSVKYKNVFIDEYQDSSEPQHRLFLKLVDLGMIGVAVGDKDQSIYEFRGGSSEYIDELRAPDSGFENFDMDLNHRCHPSISNYARRLFDKNCTLIPETDLRMYRYTFDGNQIDLGKKISEWIPAIKKSFDLKSNSEIAILVRNNFTLGYVSQGLSVPHRVYEDNPLEDFSDALSKLYTGLLHYRYNNGITTQDVLLNYVSLGLNEKQCRAFRQIIKPVRNASDDDLISVLESISDSIYGVKASVKVIAVLNDIISTASIKKQFLAKDENEIQVMTLHKAKGLEFDVVFHLDLYDWIFPKRESTGSYYDPPFYPSWDQELDLHYVGITRARKLCVLMVSNSRLNKDGEVKGGRASPFLNLPGLDGMYK